MDGQVILAGIAGGTLTLVGQHLLSLSQHRRTERTNLASSRASIRDRFVQLTHTLGHQTGDYMEVSMRGSLDADHWEALREPLMKAWIQFSDAATPLPGLGDAQLFNAARMAHTFFALRISCFYNEHPATTAMYLDFFKPTHPNLTIDDFRWNLHTVSSNRRMHWKVADEVDEHNLKLGQVEAAMPLRELRKKSPIQATIVDQQDLYAVDQWPRGHFLAMRQFRAAPVNLE